MSETQEVVAVDTDEDIDMEKLIMFVEERPLLWDKSIEEYKDRNKNREAWREICHALFPGFEDKSASEKKQLVKTWERRMARAGRNRPRVKTVSFPGGRRTASAGSCERALTLDYWTLKVI
ncbi:hypothetical protein J6590_093485 [Homalodisca vitripennis]|nr:hypothetical protein J6590_093485 [Homalodisca vitripennis]